MTKLEEQEEKKRWLKNQLRGRTRKNRPAKRVLEIAAILLEDQIEAVTKSKDELEWELEYLKGLDPKEIEAES